MLKQSQYAFIPLIIIILFVIAAFANMHFFSKKTIVKRKLKRTQHIKTEHFKTGQTAKIIGRVECVDEPLIAPLSGRKCVYYYIHIKENMGKHWQTMIKEELYNTFVLKDGEKYAYINDGNLESYIVQDRVYSSGSWNDATEVLKAYLEQHGHNSKSYFSFNKNIEYREGILRPGELTAILGKGTWMPATEVGLPAKYNDVLVITAGDTGKL